MATTADLATGWSQRSIKHGSKKARRKRPKGKVGSMALCQGDINDDMRGKFENLYLLEVLSRDPAPVFVCEPQLMISRAYLFQLFSTSI